MAVQFNDEIAILVSAVIFTGSMVGCGAASKPKVVHYEMQPVVILGDPNGDPALSGPEIAFEHAQELYDQGDSTGSLDYFDQVWKRWPTSAEAPLALYNAGLILEELSDYSAALSRYLTVIDAFPETKEARDARFRAAWCYERLREPEKTAEMASIILKEPDLTDDERFDATIRLAVAYFHMGKLDLSESMLTHALSPIGLARNLGGLDGNPVAAEAQFTLGEIWSERFRRLKLVLPIEKMKKALIEKCDLLLRAQHAYLRAMKIGDRFWAVAAAYGIGRLYDDFVDAVIQAEVPPELTEEEKGIYFCELKKYVDILARKAIRIYSRNLDMAERMGITSEWVDKAEERLKELQDKYLDQYGVCREDNGGLPAGSKVTSPGGGEEEGAQQEGARAFETLNRESSVKEGEEDLSDVEAQHGEEDGGEREQRFLEVPKLEADAGSYDETPDAGEFDCTECDDLYGAE